MSEDGIIAWDLAPPTSLPPVPWVTPFRDRGPSVRPRYVPEPQPEGTVRVVLDSAGCDGEPAAFQRYDDYPTLVEPYRVFDVPADQYERWEAALTAFLAMEDEIEVLISERTRRPRPVPSPGLPD